MTSSFEGGLDTITLMGVSAPEEFDDDDDDTPLRRKPLNQSYTILVNAASSDTASKTTLSDDDETNEPSSSSSSNMNEPRRQHSPQHDLTVTVHRDDEVVEDEELLGGQADEDEPRVVFNTTYTSWSLQEQPVTADEERALNRTIELTKSCSLKIKKTLICYNLSFFVGELNKTQEIVKPTVTVEQPVTKQQSKLPSARTTVLTSQKIQQNAPAPSSPFSPPKKPIGGKMIGKGGREQQENKQPAQSPSPTLTRPATRFKPPSVAPSSGPVSPKTATTATPATGKVASSIPRPKFSPNRPSAVPVPVTAKTSAIPAPQVAAKPPPTDVQRRSATNQPTVQPSKLQMLRPPRPPTTSAAPCIPRPSAPAAPVSRLPQK